MRLSEEEIARLLTRPGYRVIDTQASRSAVEPSMTAHVSGVMPDTQPLLAAPRGHNHPYAPYRSRTELRYARLLDIWEYDRMLLRWRYEAVRLRLAPALTLTVDFLLTFPDGVGDGRLQLHEVKGGWYREDGWQKLKQAAALYPEFRFFRVQWLKHAWHWQEVPHV